MAAQRRTGAEREAADEGPLRTCVVTRVEVDPERAIRFVRAPDGVVVADVARKLPGRGVWVALSHVVVERAVATKAFVKAFKGQATVGDDLPAHVERLLERRLTDALSLAKKSGHVLTGAQKLLIALESGRIAALVHGSDAAADGVDRLDRKFRAVSGAIGRSGMIVSELNIEQLSLALGGANVVHAGLSDSSTTRSFCIAAERLALYRGRTCVFIGQIEANSPANGLHSGRTTGQV